MKFSLPSCLRKHVLARDIFRLTKRVSPAERWSVMNRLDQTVHATSGNPAASRRETPLGIGITWPAGALTFSAYPPPGSNAHTYIQSDAIMTGLNHPMEELWIIKWQAICHWYWNGMTENTIGLSCFLSFMKNGWVVLQLKGQCFCSSSETVKGQCPGKMGSYPFELRFNRCNEGGIKR